MKTTIAAIFFFLTVPIFSVSAQVARFDVNDVSFLYPIPKTSDDVDALISMDDKTGLGNAADGIWPEDLFKQVIAQAKKTKAGQFGIDMPGEIEDVSVWRVAGIRVNPASLGGHEDILELVPEIPGVRLVVQPVTISDGEVKIHDVAAHVVFNYILPAPEGDPKKFRPDRETFKGIVKDLEEIKELCESNQVSTSGVLNIHPGFTNKVPGFEKAVSDFVAKHCRRSNLQVVSFMGLSGGVEPWVFFSMIRPPGGPFSVRHIGGFKEDPDKKVTGQMINFRSNRNGDVVPAPTADASTKKGVSMALLFNDFDQSESQLAKPVFPGTADPRLKPLQLRHVPDLIANPSMQNTVTTDCVSCHTETTKRFDLMLPESPLGIRYKLPDGISGVETSLLPRDKWNVRNFGWGLNFFAGGEFVPTVTVRTANESAESADFINRVYLKEDEN